MQSAIFLEISIILATQPLDGVQNAALRASDPLFVNHGMIEEAGNGVDLLSAVEQFSHVLAVAKYFIF